MWGKEEGGRGEVGTPHSAVFHGQDEGKNTSKCWALAKKLLQVSPQ